MKQEQLRKEYWNAIGSRKSGYFKRKDLIKLYFIGAIPIIGQVTFIVVLIYAWFKAEEPTRVPKKYRGNKK